MPPLVSSRLLPAALMLATACSTRVYSGATATSVAQVGMEAGKIMVRPNEVSWLLGERIAFERKVLAVEVGAFHSMGVVQVGQDGQTRGKLPSAVELAATREVIKRGVDGFMVTHWLIEESGSGRDASYEVRVWGRILELQDMGPMEQDRSDTRRLMQAEEGRRRAVETTDTRRRTTRPDRAAAIQSQGRQKVRVGFEVGSRAGFVVAFPVRNPRVDALTVRASGSLAIVYDYPEIVPSVSLAAEFLPDSIVQPVVGVLFGYGPLQEEPLAGAKLGIQIEPKGPVAVNVGLDAGLDFDDGGFHAMPDLSVGFLW